MIGSEPLWTVEDLAEYLKVPVSTCYAWRHRKIGPEGLRIGRHLRYRSEDVEQWLAAQKDRS